jgi:hypothetical protein
VVGVRGVGGGRGCGLRDRVPRDLRFEVFHWSLYHERERVEGKHI